MLNAVHKPAVPARVRLAKLIFDEGLLPTTLLAAEGEVLLSGMVRSNELPAMSNAVFGRIAPPFAVVHASGHRAADYLPGASDSIISSLLSFPRRIGR